MRPSLGEQAQKLYREANVLYWSKALLKMTYDFIDRCVDKATKPPPFEIPRLRFVDPGLVLAYAERPTNSGPFSGKSNAGSLSSVYLAEEVIPSAGEEGTDSFIKFIHNADAAPRELDDPAANEIAEFLSFTQHVQYTKTGGLVYLSDYQGSTSTDSAPASSYPSMALLLPYMAASPGPQEAQPSITTEGPAQREERELEADRRDTELGLSRYEEAGIVSDMVEQTTDLIGYWEVS